MDWPDVRRTRGIALRQRRPNRAHPRGAAPPTGVFQICHNEESIVLCLHPLFNISPIQGSKSLQLLTPAESTVAYVTELCRDDYFLERNTIKETSLPICVSRGGSHMQCKATQWAKVE